MDYTVSALCDAWSSPKVLASHKENSDFSEFIQPVKLFQEHLGSENEILVSKNLIQKDMKMPLDRETGDEITKDTVIALGTSTNSAPYPAHIPPFAQQCVPIQKVSVDKTHRAYSYQVGVLDDNANLYQSASSERISHSLPLSPAPGLRNTTDAQYRQVVLSSIAPSNSSDGIRCSAKYQFKPHMLNSELISNQSITPEPHTPPFLKRMELFSKKSVERMECLKKEALRKELAEATFRPNINTYRDTKSKDTRAQYCSDSHGTKYSVNPTRSTTPSVFNRLFTATTKHFKLSVDQSTTKHCKFSTEQSLLSPVGAKLPNSVRYRQFIKKQNKWTEKRDKYLQLERMKREQSELEQLTFAPTLSAKSKRIAQRRITSKQSLYDRLSNNSLLTNTCKHSLKFTEFSKMAQSRCKSDSHTHRVKGDMDPVQGDVSDRLYLDSKVRKQRQIEMESERDLLESYDKHTGQPLFKPSLIHEGSLPELTHHDPYRGPQIISDTKNVFEKVANIVYANAPHKGPEQAKVSHTFDIDRLSEPKVVANEGSGYLFKPHLSDYTRLLADIRAMRKQREDATRAYELKYGYSNSKYPFEYPQLDNLEEASTRKPFTPSVNRISTKIDDYYKRSSSDVNSNAFSHKPVDKVMTRVERLLIMKSKYDKHKQQLRQEKMNKELNVLKIPKMSTRSKSILEKSKAFLGNSTNHITKNYHHYSLNRRHSLNKSNKAVTSV